MESQHSRSDSGIAAPDPSLFRNGSRSLVSIAVQACCIGVSFASGLIIAIQLVLQGSPFWRLPAFVVCLSVFHFLEFYVTARYNVPAVRAASFLLYNNGKAYHIAHLCGCLEYVLEETFLPEPWRKYKHLVSVAIFGKPSTRRGFWTQLS